MRPLPKMMKNIALLTVMALVLSLSFSVYSQDTGDPVSQALKIARAAIEEDHGSRISLARWQFYEDNWASDSSRSLYGAFGIDSCTDSIPFAQKRSNVLFGWTFTLSDRSGAQYQARVSYDLAESVVCDEALVPPQYAPPPTASTATGASAEEQAPAVPLAPANAGPAGFALGGHVLHLSSDIAAQMRSAGMTWVKKQVRYEDGAGAAIGVINNAKANGFRVLLGTVGNKAALGANFDGYVAGFANYLAELARNGADAIEVWNEPNLDREWPAGQINGGTYTRMLQAAYQAIKAANPATWVVSGAPAPTGFFAGGCQAAGCNDDVFMQQMAQAGAAQYMDCLGLHYNEGVLSPTRNSGDPRGSYPTRYFNSMLYRGAQSFPNSKICWTELGYLSGEGMPGAIPAGFDWTPNDPVTVAEQAQWLAEAATLSRNSGRVPLMIVWNVNFTAWGSDPQAGYAMLRPGGSCPACGSLRAAMGG